MRLVQPVLVLIRSYGLFRSNDFRSVSKTEIQTETPPHFRRLLAGLDLDAIRPFRRRFGGGGFVGF